MKGIKKLRKGGSPDEVSGYEAALSNEPGISTYSGKQTSSVNSSGGNGGGGSPQINTGAKQTTTQKAGFNINPITTGLNIVGSLTAKTPGLGFALEAGKKLVQGIQKTTRQKTAKGETLFGNTQPGSAGMPITRDYYKTTGTKLDVMSPQGEQYMKDAGFLKNKGYVENTDNGVQSNLCPDGSLPPCKLPTTQIKQPVSTPNTFLSGFQAYDDGGEVVISSNVDKSLL